MLHGPYSPEHCLENGQCKKHFPKSFCPQTVMKDDGYPEYARPDNGRTIQKNDTIFTNKDVVPHPPELLVQFNCHINLEVCASIKSVKYIHKYVYKGNDCATLEMRGVVDEVKSYLDSRYISSTEAAWRIFEFSMHLEWPSVYHLPVHLPNEQMVFYDPEDNAQDVIERAAAKDTCLTGWFKANANENLVAAGAHNYLYQDFPSRFVWTKNAWKIREREVAIRRMYAAAPSSKKRFYVRLLLTVVKGMMSMIIVINQTHYVFKELPPLHICRHLMELSMRLSRKHVSTGVCLTTTMNGSSACRMLLICALDITCTTSLP